MRGDWYGVWGVGNCVVCTGNAGHGDGRVKSRTDVPGICQLSSPGLLSFGIWVGHLSSMGDFVTGEKRGLGLGSP